MSLEEAVKHVRHAVRRGVLDEPVGVEGVCGDGPVVVEDKPVPGGLAFYLSESWGDVLLRDFHFLRVEAEAGLGDRDLRRKLVAFLLNGEEIFGVQGFQGPAHACAGDVTEGTGYIGPYDNIHGKRLRKWRDGNGGGKDRLRFCQEPFL